MSRAAEDDAAQAIAAEWAEINRSSSDGVSSFAQAVTDFPGIDPGYRITGVVTGRVSFRRDGTVTATHESKEVVPPCN